ncbi:hypothetical protein [Hydrogenovibrio marinus]|uniref:Uncharacterized protein n=1 Tax=Hydrogenovibrio marinus TaxID=28885 RepID=A0A066ZWU6_HYDMR|nr:hypothetical protein [Hydrogenovibrio marinus]KDN94826.1 hypothetical protein EI16_00485 [Hydrogenovibrio marinus]BBN59285.1 hypothetical protein HVMH_0879 [Hydrogenovibrio marinus]
MATRKINDLAVAIETYKDPQTGLDKNKYLNIGVEMETDDGGRFIILESHINLAALPRKPGKSGVMVSKYPVDGRNDNNGQQQTPPQQHSPQTQTYVWPHNNQPMTPQEVSRYQNQQINPPLFHNDQWSWSDGQQMTPNEIAHFSAQQPR